MPTLLASAARTTDGAGDWIALPTGKTGAVFQLTVSAAATEVGDLLDVYIQHSVDGGTTAQDFVRFTQVLGNGGAKKYIAHWVALMTPTSALHAPQDGAMSAGVNQGPIGDLVRVKWDITDVTTTGNLSFTFSVSYTPTF